MFDYHHESHGYTSPVNFRFPSSRPHSRALSTGNATLRYCCVERGSAESTASWIFFWHHCLPCEIGGFANLPNFDLGLLVERGALEPFDGFFHGLHLPEPVATDQFLGFGERPVDYGTFLPGKSDALAL